MFEYYEKEILSVFKEFKGMSDSQKTIALMDLSAQTIWNTYTEEQRATFLVEGIMRIFFLQGTQPFKLKKTRNKLLRRVRTEDAKYLIEFCYEHVKVEATVNGGRS